MEIDGDTSLCFLDASRVQTPGGALARMNVCGPEGENVGCVDGVLIDCALGRVRYLLVGSAQQPRHDHYLVPADGAVRVEGGTLRLESRTALLPGEGIDIHSVRPFNDDDLLSVLFASRAA
ncbi:MAG TPA: PRC-barrel domain-containing protein [Vicinamibacterales bacterium]|nr:PRC-barrel domain-containing protein [Vicinamibacterales bacterium]